MSNLHGKELDFTGRLFGGFIDDIRRKAPYYSHDFKAGLHSKVAGTTLFLFFAALANAIAFGALTDLLTGNEIGIMVMLVSLLKQTQQIVSQFCGTQLINVNFTSYSTLYKKNQSCVLRAYNVF